jgi:hypothetical protein
VAFGSTSFDLLCRGMLFLSRAIDILTALSESDEITSDFILNTGAGMLVKSLRK